MEKKALQFHRITPDIQFCGTWNTPAQFERFLHCLQNEDIPVILPEQSGKGIIITFDDGESSLYDHAFPLLRQYNMRAIVFLIVDYVGRENTWDISLTGRYTRNLTWEQIREMKEWGIEFGSHTMTHRNLTHLSCAAVRDELVTSKRIIESVVGECRYLSYPFNRTNALIMGMAARAGYHYAFGGYGTSDLALKKEALYITDTTHSLQIKIREKPSVLYWYERTKQQIINLFTIATMVAKRSARS